MATFQCQAEPTQVFPSLVGLPNPAEIYRELKDALHGEKQSRSDWDTMTEIFKCFSKSSWASNQALGIYIGASVFPTAAHKFCNFFLKRLKTDLVKYLVSLGPGNESDKFLFPLFVEFCADEFQEEIKMFRKMVESADMTKPESWFPFARAMKRKIIYHCGPTNSGKTYNALQSFMEAKKGVYCSPLRLLAMEVFDKVNTLGVYCSLITGQEKKDFPFSNHVACTVEMVSTDELYDVAVIDEIQMMADPCRGYAWTRALLGLKADEIHLCGDPSVLNVVRTICLVTGDELIEQRYERFKPLVVEAKTLVGDLKNVRSGDCIVAFSRREIFEVKLAIEKHTKHRCCVIYGALPPETRRQQATLFNNQDNEFDVLVASDAVGMGLNLNIKRTVFYNLSKYNGDKMVPVPASQVKQIAGRAGRRGSRYPEGLTTTLQLEDLDYLIECLKKPFDDVKKVGLFPFFEQVELFAALLPDMKFSRLLEKFVENCRLDGSYFMCQHQHIKKIANMLERIQGLSLENRFNFCFAPVNIRDPKAMYHLLRFASSYAQKLPVNVAMGIPKCSARNDSELLDLETRHQVLSMYLWLSNHFEEERFPYVKKAETMAIDIAKLLGESLINACWKPESRNASKSKRQNEEDDYKRPTSIIKLHQNDATLAAKSKASELQKQLQHLQFQNDMLTEQASALIQGRKARVSATSTANGQLTTIDDSLSARNLEMNAVLGRMASTAQELAHYHSGDENGIYLTYADFHPYLVVDSSCMEQLNQWFTKQLDTGPYRLVAEEGKSKCSWMSLNETSKVLVRDLENTQHQRLSELQRLRSIFGTSERQWVEAQVENAKQQAILMMLKAQVTSDDAHIHLDLHSLRRKHAELAGELSTLYRREEKLLSETIPDLCWELAQLQDTYILQGDYDLKVMRQEFYINRQKAFISHLINQLSRHQFLKIACQLEKKTLLGAYSLLKVIELELQGYLSVGKGRVGRCIALAEASSDVPEQGAVDDRDTFLHGVRDLLSIYSNAQVGLSTYVSAPGLVQQLSNLQSDLMTLQSDLDYTLPEDRNRCINELCTLVQSLQQLLFASSTTAQPILTPWTLMKELDEMAKVNAKLSTAVEDVTMEHCKKNEIVKHHSQEMALQRRVFVDFFCNPERLRNQVKELTARVRALQLP